MMYWFLFVRAYHNALCPFVVTGRSLRRFIYTAAVRIRYDVRSCHGKLTPSRPVTKSSCAVTLFRPPLVLESLVKDHYAACPGLMTLFRPPLFSRRYRQGPLCILS